MFSVNEILWLFFVYSFLGWMFVFYWNCTRWSYEYLCSVFTEIVFGKVFWDYSHMAFNLGGRVNLLYCFLGGIAAVIWFKKLFPAVLKIIEMIPKQIGKIVTCGNYIDPNVCGVVYVRSKQVYL